MQGYLGHRDLRHTGHYTCVARHRFEGLRRQPPPEGAETSADKRAATKAALRKLGFEPALIKAVPARDRMHSFADVSVCEEMPADFGR